MRLLVVVAALVALHRPADACSVTRTFLPPSNFELVTNTPRIVIAKAVGSSLVKTGPKDEMVGLEITRVIKGGGKPGERVDVRGYTLKYLGAGSKTDFSKARRGAYAGGCIAFDYKLDKHYLLFLKEYSGTWQVAGEPFTRVNEEVDLKSDPWTTAVEAYVKIGALPVADRAKAIDALIAKTATPTDKAIALDLVQHRAMPSPYKSFAELDAMFRADPDNRGRIAIAIGTGGDQAAKPFMKNLVQSVRDGAPTVDAQFALVAIGAYYLKVSDPPVLAQIAELYIALGTKQKQARWDVMWLLIKRADASHQAVMERALAGADDEEAGRLVDFFARSPSAAATKDIAKRVGGTYAEKWEMAIGLAGLGDKDVIKWADKMLAAKPGDENRWMALYAIAMSPLPEADVLAGKVIAKGGSDLESMVQGYAKAQHPRVDARLAEIGKNPKLPAETRKWLDRTIAERKSPP
jgi:hypothetical protein